jgi:hypothetical protein
VIGNAAAASGRSSERLSPIACDAKTHRARPAVKARCASSRWAATAMAGQPLFQIVYVSSAVRELLPSELAELLVAARARNEQSGITGMLLYSEGSFMQVMEGPQAAVETLYARIERDARHTGCIRLLAKPIVERQFAEWCMGFRTCSRRELEALPGYSDFLGTPGQTQAIWGDPKGARRLLQSFRSRL